MGANPCFVDLGSSSEEDEDDDLVCLTELPAHLLGRWSKNVPIDVATQSETDVTILEDGETVRLHARDDVTNYQKSSQDSSLEEDDCCILDSNPEKVDFLDVNKGNDSDDLVMTGENGHVACRDYPHPRHLCVKFPFKSVRHKEFCSQCHCYVCDTLAPCPFWGDGLREGDHCHASDKVGENWKMLRNFIKTQPAGAPNLSGFAQLKDRPAQVFPERLGLERTSRVSASRGMSTSATNARRLSSSLNFGTHQSGSAPSFSIGIHPLASAPSVNIGIRLGRQGDDRASRQVAEPFRHPLEISLNSHPQDPGFHSRRSNSQHLGMRTRINKFGQKHPHVHRKESLWLTLGQSYPSEDTGRCLHRRSAMNGVHLNRHRPHPSQRRCNQTSESSCALPQVERLSQTRSGQISESCASPHADRSSPPTVLLGEEVKWDLVSSLDSAVESDFLREVVPAILSPCDEQGDLSHESLITDDFNLLSPNDFQTPYQQSEYEVGGTNRGQGGEDAGSLQSVVDYDSEFGVGTNSGKMGGNLDSVALQPPTLLIDYLLDDTDFWSNFSACSESQW